MQTPLTITSRGTTTSPSLEAAIQRWVERIERDYEDLQRCAVAIDAVNHGRHGDRFQVRIDLHVPGIEIAISREPEHEDPYVAVADAFRAARRQLRDYARVRRGDIKSHVA
jgi:ribosome-associated translation inhibitor RaiA